MVRAAALSPAGVAFGGSALVVSSFFDKKISLSARMFREWSGWTTLGVSFIAFVDVLGFAVVLLEWPHFLDGVPYFLKLLGLFYFVRVGNLLVFPIVFWGSSLFLS